MTLYKYVPAERIDILQTELIRYTQPRSLNDPFEMTPYFSELFSPSELKKMLTFGAILAIIRKTEQVAKWPSITQALLAAVGWLLIKFSRTLKNNMFAVIETMSFKMTREWHAMMEKHLRSTIGVLSLSAKHDNLSMWAHYASNHTGFVIALDETHAVFNERLSPKDELRHVRAVKYSESKPVLTLSAMSGTEMFLRKSKEWEHEEEWRIIKPLDSASASGIASTPNGGLLDSGVRLFALPAAAIQGVILGARMTSGYREMLLDSVRTNDRYEHAWVKEARLQNDKFALKFVRLPGRPQFHRLNDLQLSVEGLPDSKARALGDRITEVVHYCTSCHFKLSKAKTIFVVENVKLSAEERFQITCRDDPAIAFAIPKENGFEIVGFVRRESVLPLLDDDGLAKPDAVHFLHRHLAHVHNITLRYETLGYQALTEQNVDVQSLLRQVAMAVWNEYIVARLSAPSLTENASDEALLRLRTRLERSNLDIAKEIVSYRNHKDITHLTRKVQIACAELLGDTATVLGYTDGTGKNLLDTDSTLRSLIDARRFRDSLDGLAAALRSMNAEYPEWEDASIYDGIAAVIRDLCFIWGIAFRELGKRAYVAVL